MRGVFFRKCLFKYQENDLPIFYLFRVVKTNNNKITQMAFTHNTYIFFIVYYILNITICFLFVYKVGEEITKKKTNTFCTGFKLFHSQTVSE